MPAAPAPRTSAFGLSPITARASWAGATPPRRCAAFAFDALAARRVEIRCEPLNRPSARVAERAGFRLEGQLPNDAVGTDGATRSTLVFAMTREDLAGG